MDMVRVKQKCGMRRNVEACSHMETTVCVFFSAELLFALVVCFLNTLELTSNLMSIFMAF